MYRLGHENLRRLAEDLAEAASREGFELTTRPWNRFEPDETEWWLVPSSDWPAYKHGKIYLRWKDSERRLGRACLHIEKGLGAETAPAYDAPRGRRLIMDRTWTWHLLKDPHSADGLQASLARLSARSPGRVEIALEVGYVADPDAFDPYAYDFGRDKFKYALTDDSQSLTLFEADAGAGLLENMETVRSVRKLAARVTALPGKAWTWVEFTAGVPIHLDAEPRAEGPTVLASELWTDLSLFRPWLRAAE